MNSRITYGVVSLPNIVLTPGEQASLNVTLRDAMIVERLGMIAVFVNLSWHVRLISRFYNWLARKFLCRISRRFPETWPHEQVDITSIQFSTLEQLTAPVSWRLFAPTSFSPAMNTALRPGMAVCIGVRNQSKHSITVQAFLSGPTFGR